ncbi:MAG TPA: response regulator [Ktedonobacterales bacterium]|nr:response regulator [Ktedonobacterales bacterium]
MPTPTPTRTVLIIDDEAPIRTAVRFILEEEGYAVLEAPDGRVGLDLLRASDGPLIVLLDLLLPTMSGVVLLHSLAAELTLAERHAFIIFSATRAFSAPTLQSYLPGKRLFDLPKPFDVDDLVAIVGQAVRQLEGEHDAG